MRPSAPKVNNNEASSPWAAMVAWAWSSSTASQVTWPPGSSDVG
ncbi:MAG: hypothetical protein R2710_08250 [Acidimicrobiales bacterium]